MSKIIKITVLLSLSSLKVFSQDIKQTTLEEKIIKVMNEQIKVNEFKDSSSVYSFTLKIIIDYSNKK